jgi:hypothetical protein
MLVLRGTVVTMRPGGAVLEQGEVYAGDDGLIAAVTPGDPVPAGFQDAPRVATGGLIYPGLIDLQFMDNGRKAESWRFRCEQACTRGCRGRRRLSS